jgi:hypothetical protein
MQLFSGKINYIYFSPCLSKYHHRTQESLDHGVEKVSDIYKNYVNNVGIKDRSMIWNSLVLALSTNLC